MATPIAIHDRGTTASNWLAPSTSRVAPRTGDAWRVLMIQGERSTSETAGALQSLRVESSWAHSGLDGLATAERWPFDLIFVDFELADMSGAAVIQAIRGADELTRFIVTSSDVTAAVTRDALRLGAVGVLGKPLAANDLIVGVRAALGGGVPQVARVPRVGIAPPRQNAPRSIAERWARLMLETIRADADPKTIHSWARAIGMSRSVLCECCRLVHVSPHDARDFARLMRVISRSGPKWQPEVFLDLSDARTLKKLLTRAGLDEAVTRTPHVLEFVDRQQWIPRSNSGLVALRTLLAATREW